MMNNLDKYKSLLGDAVDGLLLTSRYSRHYAAEFDIAEGVALVSRKGCRYFTDSRTLSPAERDLRGLRGLARGPGAQLRPPASTRRARPLASGPWDLRKAI